MSERLLGESRLLAKSLTADVERLTREKKDQADRAEAKQVSAANPMVKAIAQHQFVAVSSWDVLWTGTLLHLLGLIVMWHNDLTRQ
jgi:hypothetical protein